MLVSPAAFGILFLFLPIRHGLVDLTVKAGRNESLPLKAKNVPQEAKKRATEKPANRNRSVRECAAGSLETTMNVSYAQLLFVNNRTLLGKRCRVLFLGITGSF